MAKPRVFVSSTYYDLKHVRASLEAFIDSLGFDAVLFESGDVPFSPDAPLDESCYEEVHEANIFVMIIGGRYGSAASSESLPEDQDERTGFYEKYNSVSRKELETALKNDTPAYFLVDAGVLAEYETYKRNRDAEIDYAHVDSINVFRLLDDIFALKKGNPVESFERASDIEIWLRDQWAGLFRVLLKQRATNRQIASLTTKIGELSDVTQTLRRYSEEIFKHVDPDDSEKVVDEESERLRKATFFRSDFWQDNTPIFPDDEFNEVYSAFTQSSTFEEFADCVDLGTFRLAVNIQLLANKARTELSLPPFPDVESPPTKRRIPKRRPRT